MKKIFIILIFLAKQLFCDAQNVGIGTNNPSRAKLEVYGAVEATSAIFGGDSSGISLQRNWPGIGFNSYFGGGLHRMMSNGYGALITVDPFNGYMTLDMLNGQRGWYAAPTRALVISKEGKVNIGSASVPYANLNVARGSFWAPHYATAAFEGSSYHSFFNYGSTEDTYLRAGKDNGTVIINDIPGSKVALSGLVGINTATPATTLEIRQQNGGLSLVEPGSWNNWEFRVQSSMNWLHLFRNGQLAGRFYEDGRYAETSDRRLKTDIQPLPAILGKVMKLEPVEYKLKNVNTPHKTIGFIAQDVMKLFPDLVRVETDTTSRAKGIKDLHTLTYTSFGILAIKAIQEQQQEIETLKKENETLKQSAASQKNTIEDLAKNMERMEKQMAALVHTKGAIASR